jgi:hypothetical protein
MQERWQSARQASLNFRVSFNSSVSRRSHTQMRRKHAEKSMELAAKPVR